MRWRSKVAIGVVVVLLLVSCIAPDIFDIPAVLLTGWGPFLRRTAGQVTFDPVAVISAVVCLLLVAGGLHWVCSWLYRQMRSAGTTNNPRWRLRWTGAMVGILVLMFAAGISMVALAHQALWLARSPRPLYMGHEGTNRIICASRMRQIGQAILLYARDHNGRFPNRLEELCDKDLLNSPQVFVCPSSCDQVPQGVTTQQWVAQLAKPGNLSYIYIGQGLTDSRRNDNRPVLYEPLDNHSGDGMNVLFADGHVEFLLPPEAQKCLEPFVTVPLATRP